MLREVKIFYKIHPTKWQRKESDKWTSLKHAKPLTENELQLNYCPGLKISESVSVYLFRKFITMKYVSAKFVWVRIKKVRLKIIS